MPGTPGPRLTGDDVHASDAHLSRGRDTPYDSASSLPMTNRTVGGSPYCRNASQQSGELMAHTVDEMAGRS